MNRQQLLCYLNILILDCLDSIRRARAHLFSMEIGGGREESTDEGGESMEEGEVREEETKGENVKRVFCPYCPHCTGQYCPCVYSDLD